MKTFYDILDVVDDRIYLENNDLDELLKELYGKVKVIITHKFIKIVRLEE